MHWQHLGEILYEHGQQILPYELAICFSITNAMETNFVLFFNTRDVIGLSLLLTINFYHVFQLREFDIKTAADLGPPSIALANLNSLPS